MLATFTECVKVVLYRYTMSTEFLLLLVSESCIVCASVLRPNMASVLSS